MDTLHKANLYVPPIWDSKGNTRLGVYFTILTPVIAIIYGSFLLWQQDNNVIIETRIELNSNCEPMLTTCTSSYWCDVAFSGEKTRARNSGLKQIQLAPNETMSFTTCYGNDEHIDILSYNGIEANPNNPFISYKNYKATEVPRAAFVDNSGQNYVYATMRFKPSSLVKIDINNMTRVSTLTLLPGEFNIFSGFSDDRGYGYLGTATAPALIVKVNLRKMTRVASMALNGGEDNIMSAFVDIPTRHGYFCLRTTPAKVVKINLDTMKRISKLVLDSSDSDVCVTIQHGNNTFGYMTMLTKVVKFSLSSMKVEFIYNYPDTSRGVVDGFLDVTNGYGYIVDRVAGVVKYDMSTMNQTMTTTKKSTNTQQLMTQGFADGSGYAYISLGQTPGRLMILSTDTMTYTTNDILPDDYLANGVCLPFKGYGYCFGNALPSTVFKFKLLEAIPKTIDGLVTMPTLTSEIYPRATFTDDQGYGYTVFATLPGQVIKYHLSNMTRVSSLIVSNIKKRLTNVGFAVDGYGYLTTDTEPSYIIKIQLSDMTYVDSILLDYDENSVYAAFSNNGYAYFATCISDSFQSSIIKISLSTFSRVDSTIIDTSCLKSAISDGSDYGWFLSRDYYDDSTPTTVYKIKLADLSIENSMTYDDASSGGWVGMIERSIIGDQYAYTASYSIPSFIYKIRLNDLVLVNKIQLPNGINKISDMCHDIHQDFVVFGTDQNPAYLIKAKASDLTVTSIMDLQFGQQAVTSCMISTQYSNVYVSINVATTNNMIFSVPLESFDSASGLNSWFLTGMKFNLGQDYFHSMTTDNDGYGYVLTAASVLKIALSDMSKVATAKVPLHTYQPHPSYYDGMGHIYYCISSYSLPGVGRLIQIRLSDMTVIKEISVRDWINRCNFKDNYAYIINSIRDLLKISLPSMETIIDTYSSAMPASIISSWFDDYGSIYYLGFTNSIYKVSTTTMRLTKKYSITNVTAQFMNVMKWNDYVILSDIRTLYKLNMINMTIETNQVVGDNSTIHQYTYSDGNYGYVVTTAGELWKINLEDNMNRIDKIDINDVISYSHVVDSDYAYLLGEQTINKIFLPTLLQKPLTITPNSYSSNKVTASSYSLKVGANVKFAEYSVQPLVNILLDKSENTSYLITSPGTSTSSCLLFNTADYGYCSRISLSSSRVVTTISRPYDWLSLIGALGGAMGIVTAAFKVFVAFGNKLLLENKTQSSESAAGNSPKDQAPNISTADAAALAVGSGPDLQKSKEGCKVASVEDSDSEFEHGVKLHICFDDEQIEMSTMP